MVQPSPPSLKIRFATASDHVLLAEIGAETFHHSFAAQNTPENMAQYLDQCFSPEKQARELADPACTFLIADVDGHAAGYAHLKNGPAPTSIRGRKPIEIARFYARVPWIGKGIGARLMQACLFVAAQANCDVVWLGVWEHNPRAIAFYRQWGFEELGTQSFQLGGDVQRDLLMARKTPVPEAAWTF